MARSPDTENLGEENSLCANNYGDTSWVIVEIVLRRILLHHVFCPSIQNARQNFTNE